MRTFKGAQWVSSPGTSPVLLLASEPISGGGWLYTYSVTPGEVVQVVTWPAPGAADPADTIMARIVNDLAGGQQ
jgi:hypothetical protein